MALLSLQEENPGVHANSSPFNGLGHLPLPCFDLFSIPHEINKVQGVVEGDFVFQGATYLTLDFFLTVRLLIFVVDVVDPNLIALSPQLGDA